MSKLIIDFIMMMPHIIQNAEPISLNCGDESERGTAGANEAAVHF